MAASSAGSQSTRSTMPRIAASTGVPAPPHGVGRGLAVEHDQHLFPHAGTHRVHRQQHRASRRLIGRRSAARAAASRLRSGGASGWPRRSRRRGRVASASTIPVRVKAGCSDRLPMVDDARRSRRRPALPRDETGTTLRARERRTQFRRRPAPTASAAIERAAGRLPVGTERLQNQQLQRRELRSPSASTTTSPITRASCTSAALHFDLVDDADDGGIDGTVLQA